MRECRRATQVADSIRRGCWGRQRMAQPETRLQAVPLSLEVMWVGVQAVPRRDVRQRTVWGVLPLATCTEFIAPHALSAERYMIYGTTSQNWI